MLQIARFALFSCLLSPFAASALDPPPPPDSGNKPFSFSVDVRMVVLQTTVLNNKGAFVKGLKQTNFQVLEDRQPQQLQLFQQGDSPVAVGLIVDNSGSMRRKHAAVLAAAKAFTKNSNPKDELFIVNFSDQPTLGLPNTQMYSANQRQLQRALPVTAGGGKSALYDALELGLDHVRGLKQDKKALILISDGGDNASRHTIEQVMADATNSNVVVFTIGLFGKYSDETNPDFLKQIARVTGGQAYLPARPTQAATTCKKIAQVIRNTYTLGYSPSKVEDSKSFRAVQVRVSARNKTRLVARTRVGYTPENLFANNSVVSR